MMQSDSEAMKLGRFAALLAGIVVTCTPQVLRSVGTEDCDTFKIASPIILIMKADYMYVPFFFMFGIRPQVQDDCY